MENAESGYVELREKECGGPRWAFITIYIYIHKYVDIYIYIYAYIYLLLLHMKWLQKICCIRPAYTLELPN